MLPRPRELTLTPACLSLRYSTGRSLRELPYFNGPSASASPINARLRSALEHRREALRHLPLNLIRRTLISAMYLAFACRLLVPAGYMPAAWGEGGPIALCPTGLPAALMPEHSGHHHDDGTDTDHLWENCPLGTLADTAAITPNVVFNLPVSLDISPTDLGLRSTFSRRPADFRSRSPPSFFS